MPDPTAATEAPTSIQILPSHLKELLSSVLPFADRSSLVLGYNRVGLRGVAATKTITSLATDRYSVGAAKIEQETPDFDFSLSTDDCKRILSLYPAPRRRADEKPIAVALTDAEATFSQPGQLPSITCTVDASKFAPGVTITKLLAKVIRSDPAPIPGWTARPDLVSRVKHLGESVRFTSTGDGKPLLVTANGFVGAIMPLRLRDGVDRDHDAWLSLFPMEEEAVAA